MRPSPQPSLRIEGIRAAHLHGQLRQAFGAYGHGHAVESMPWKWMLPMRLRQQLVGVAVDDVTVWNGFRIACTSSASSVQKFQGR